MATSNTISTINSSGVISDVPIAFDIERDLIHPASEVVGNLRDAIEAIGEKRAVSNGDRADTRKASAEVDRLRDLLDHADAVAVEAMKKERLALETAGEAVEQALHSFGHLEAILEAISETSSENTVQISRLAYAGLAIAKAAGTKADDMRTFIVDAIEEIGGAA